MVAPLALEDLLAGTDEAGLAPSLEAIPPAELPARLKALARRHGAEALPLLARLLHDRTEWALAAAEALGTIPSEEAARALQTLAPDGPKALRTAARRALYRLRQAGIRLETPAPRRRAPARPTPVRAWVSALDGTGCRGLWLALQGSFGEWLLLSFVLSDEAGILDFQGGPIARKRLDAEVERLESSPLPWVDLPPAAGLGLVAEALARHAANGAPPPGEFARWLLALDLPEAPPPPLVYDLLDREAIAGDPGLLDHSAELLEARELAGWFLDPGSVQAEAVELLEAKESRLVVSDQVKAERQAAIVDKVIEAQFGPEARRRWARRLEEEAAVLARLGREPEARWALAVALALADPEREPRRIPWVRRLVERGLEIAGEVSLGRVSAEEVSRRPRPPSPAPVP